MQTLQDLVIYCMSSYPIWPRATYRCRWNLVKAEDTGITLQLLPMLIGFFTYKVAVFTKQGAVLLNDLREKPL